MKNLLREGARKEIRERLATLEPSTNPLWGRMNATSMLAHCSAQISMSLGEIDCKQRQSMFNKPPIKQLVVYWLHWPKGAPTAPELLRPEPDTWDAEKESLLGLVERFPAAIQSGPAPHPIFGKLSTAAWGRLAYRHLDHHLRQFGA